MVCVDAKLEPTLSGRETDRYNNCSKPLARVLRVDNNNNALQREHITDNCTMYNH